MYIIIQQNCAGNKQKSYEIMRMNMFAVYDKAKPDIGNIRDLNLAAVKLTAVQVTKLSKIGTICFTKPGLREELYIGQKQRLAITCYMCHTYT
jgi:hypothetical protein